MSLVSLMKVILGFSKLSGNQAEVQGSSLPKWLFNIDAH